jgi:hypothetical protein
MKRSTFNVQRLAFGVQRSAFSVWRSETLGRIQDIGNTAVFWLTIRLALDCGTLPLKRDSTAER